MCIRDRYYSLEKQEDKEKQKQEYERLEEVWSQRDSYYGKWERCRREKTVENRNGIKVPANWQYNSFWFAGAAGILSLIHISESAERTVYRVSCPVRVSERPGGQKPSAH